jgi:hypothetical protein
MEMLELLKEHPKSAIVVKQWFLEKMLESIKDESVPEDFKNLVREQGIDDEKVAGVISNAPRSLFDVFDSHKIYVSISCVNDKFLWGINDDMNNSAYSSRIEADKAAVIDAFKQLEAKL